MNSAVKHNPSKLLRLFGQWAPLAALLMALPASGQLKQSATQSIEFKDATLDPINSVPSKADPFGVKIEVGETMAGMPLSTSHKIQKVAVRLPGLTHSYLADLDVLVAGPDGLGVMLMSDVALNQAAGNLDLTIRDGATTFPVGVVPPLASGNYSPGNYPSNDPSDPDAFPDAAFTPPAAANLGVFSGKNARGTTWRLYAMDDRFNDKGNMGPWELQLWIQPILTISNKTDQQVSPADTITIGRWVDGDGKTRASMFEDVAYEIPVVVNDPDTAPANITMSVVDISDVNIIPNAQADEGWQITKPSDNTPGTREWKVRLKTKANQFGNLTLRIKVDDGGGTIVYFPLNVVVEDVNDKPTITKLERFVDGAWSETSTIVANQGVLSSDTYRLVVADTDAGDVATLAVSGQSFNTDIVTDTDIFAEALDVVAGANRKIRIAPKGDASNTAASAAFDIFVTDDGDKDGVVDVNFNEPGVKSDPKRITFTVNPVTDRFVKANPDPIALPDAGTSIVKKDVVIPSGTIGARIGAMTATLANFNHKNPKDATVVLTGPNNKSIVLMHDVGGTGGGANQLTGARIALGDNLAAIPTDGPLVSNPANQDVLYDAYKPTTSGSALPAGFPAIDGTVMAGAGGIYDNLEPNGTWSVRAIDRGGGEAGSVLGGVVLTFFTRPVITGQPASAILFGEDATTAFPVNLTLRDLDGKITKLKVEETTAGTKILNGVTVDETYTGDNSLPTKTKTLNVTPKLHAFGAAEVTITATDNSNFTQVAKFTVEVKAINDPPTISDIQKQVVYTGQLVSDLLFKVTDVEPFALGNGLGVTRSSDNLKLLPVANAVIEEIAVGASSKDLLVSLFPAAGETGVANIDIRVTDAGQKNDLTGAMPDTATSKDTTTRLRLEVYGKPSPTFSVPGPLAIDINDAGVANPGVTAKATPYPSVPPEVKGLHNRTAKVYVNLYEVRSIPNDLAVALVGPEVDPVSGERRAVVLTRNNGGDTRVGPLQLRFDDDAADSAFSAGGTLASGLFKPDPNYNSLGALDGIFPSVPVNSTGAIDWSKVRVFPTFKDAFADRSPNGSWSLYVLDDNGNGKSNDQVGSWMLTIETKPVLADIPDQEFEEGKLKDVTIDTGDEQPGVPLKITLTEVIQPPAESLPLVKSYIVSPPSIDFAGADKRVISITPNPDVPRINSTATARLEVKVERFALIGGVATPVDAVSKQFNLTAKQFNDPPTIGTTPADLSVTVPAGLITPKILFTVSDVETAPADLDVKVTSKDTSLLPNANIVSGGSGADRWFYIIPNGSKDVSVAIVITVTDKGSTATTDGKDGKFTTKEIPYSAVGSGVTVFANSNPIQLLQNGAANPYPVQIPVAGVKGVVGKVRLAVHGFYHAFPDDISMVLVSPGSSPKKVVLMSNAGGGNPDNSIELAQAAALIFTPDTAGVPVIPDTLAAWAPPAAKTILQSGYYQPAKYGASVTFVPTPNLPVGPLETGSLTTSLNEFANIDPNGTWLLYIFDDTFSDSGGILNGISLAFETAPTVNIVGSLETPEDIKKTLVLEIQDSDTTNKDPSPFSITAETTSAEGQAIVPTANLKVVGTGLSRNLEITPLENRYGDVKNIKLTITDGPYTSTKEFAFKVTPTDDPPVIKADRYTGTPKEYTETVDEDFYYLPGGIPLTLPFTVSDVDSDIKLSETRTITVQGADILPNEDDNIVTNAPLATIPMGTEGKINVQLITAVNAFGTALVQFNVKHGATYVTTNIVLKVNSKNDEPYFVPSGFQFANQTFPKNQIKPGESRTLNFKIGDVETPVKDLKPLPGSFEITSSDNNAVPVSAMTISANNDERALTIRAVGDKEVRGVVITVTVSDTDPLDVKKITRQFLVDVEGPAIDPSNTFASTDKITIPGASDATSGKASPYPAIINPTSVKDLKGAIHKLAVVLDGFKHAVPDDCDMLLVGPNSIGSVVLMSDAGGSIAVENLRVEFSDDGQDMRDDGPLTSGRWRPANFGGPVDPDVWPPESGTGASLVPTGTRLDTFRGKNPNGEWKLYVVDDTGLHVGEITKGWALKITTTPVIFVNSVPTSAIRAVDQTYSEDGNPTPSPIWGGFSYSDPDATTPADKLELKATSLAPDIIPANLGIPGVVIVGTDLQVRPADHKYTGSDEKNPAVVQLTVTRPSIDDASWTLSITNLVRPRNDDPINSRLVDRAMDEGSTLPLEFRVVDNDYPDDAVSVTVQSLDQSIVKDGDIDFEGTTSNNLDPIPSRLLRVNIRHVPGITDTGAKKVMIRVTTRDKSTVANHTVPNPPDQNRIQDVSPNNEDVDELEVTVSPFNDPPVITGPAAQPAATAGSPAEFEITVNDPDTRLDKLEAKGASLDPNKVKTVTVVRKTGQADDKVGESKWLVQYTPEVGSKGEVKLSIEVKDKDFAGKVDVEEVTIGIGPSRERRYTPVADQLPITINDYDGQPARATPYPSTIRTDVTTADNPALVGDVAEVKVEIIGLTHKYPDDVDVILVAPNGKGIVLMSDAGGSTPADNISLLFWSKASLPEVPDAQGLVSNTQYRPANHEGGDVIPGGVPSGTFSTDLNSLVNTPAGGEWKLYVIDDTRQDAGKITSWALRITTKARIEFVGNPDRSVKEDETFAIDMNVIDEAFAAPQTFSFEYESTDGNVITPGAPDLVTTVVKDPLYRLNGKPRPYASGTSKVTLKAKSAEFPQHVATGQFNLTVASVNNKPEFTRKIVGSKYIQSGTLSQELDFDYFDAETEKKFLAFDVFSTNEKVVPTNNVYIVGSVLYIVPAGVLTGESDITLKVRELTGDKLESDPMTFKVVVQKALNAQFAGTATVIIDNAVNSGKASPYPNPIDVSKVAGKVSKVTVSLSKFTHPYPADVDVLLVGPNAKGVLLMSDAGGGRKLEEAWFNFDDAHAAVMPANPTAPLASGGWKPSNYDTSENFPSPAPTKPAGGYPATLDEAFKGIDPNGQWQLFILDDAAPDGGDIEEWVLNIHTDEPSIGTISPVEMNENGTPVPISFTVSDGNTPLADLTWTAVVDRASLATVTPASGKGTDTKFTITPVPYANGSTTVTVTVSDGTSFIPTTFALQIDPVNFPPTISGLSDKSTPSNRTLIIPFTVGDPDFEDPTDGLEAGATIGDASYGSVTTEGTGGNRRLVFQPKGEIGAAEVTVTVSDGDLSTAQKILVTVGAPYVLTVAPIADQTVNEDGSKQVQISVSGSETGNVNVAAVSADPTLILQPIEVKKTDIGWVATLVAAPDKVGSTQITVIAADEFGTGEAKFMATVVPTDDPPVIGAIPDQSTLRNQSVTFDIPVTDKDTPIASLVFSWATSNPTLINNVAFGERSGGIPIATVFPARDQTGQASITIFAFDGTTKVGQPVLVTVSLPPNEAPVFGPIADQSTIKNIPLTIDLPLTDSDTPVAQIVMTATSSDPAVVKNVLFGIKGGTTITATLRPVNNATGVTRITITANDGDNSVSQSFNLTVSDPPNEPPVFGKIPDQTTTANKNVTVELDITDPDTAVPDLVLTGSSSNPTLVTGYTFDQTGAKPKATVVLGKDKTGIAVVTITVNDGKTTVSQSFALQVNEAPVPKLANPAVTSNPDGTLTVVVTWENDGELEWSLSPTGPWTKTGNTSGRYTEITTQQVKFFQITR